jgi:hypothetical protein
MAVVVSHQFQRNRDLMFVEEPDQGRVPAFQIPQRQG